jgi:hypothetical protein
VLQAHHKTRSKDEQQDGPVKRWVLHSKQS